MQSLPSEGVSVVIAVYNEIDNIEILIAEIEKSLAAVTHFEIIAVDDNSQDGSRQRLMQLAQQKPHLRLIKHVRNFGQSIAIVSGARAARYPWVLTLDGDGQNDPADFIKLFAALKNVDLSQPVLVTGVRVQRNDNWVRRQSSKVANRVRDSLLHDDCPDSACGLKLFQKAVFLQLPHFNHLHRFLPALYKRINGLIINVPVNHRPRLRGQSKYGTLSRLWVGIFDILGVMWLIHRPCPLETDQQCAMGSKQEVAATAKRNLLETDDVP